MYCWMELSDIYGFPTGHVWGFPDEMHTFVHTWFWVMVASFFCLLEVGGNNIYLVRFRSISLYLVFLGSFGIVSFVP